MEAYRIEPLWKGQSCFIIGGGPSLKDMDLSPIHNHNVIGVNDAFKLGPWVDICWFGDCRWAVWNHEALTKFGGEVITCVRCNCQHPAVQVRRTEQKGISTNPEEVRWNRSSGASAINLAFHLGVTKIILLGFDMQVRDGQHNWHTNHKHHPRHEVYQERMITPFESITRDAKTLGIEIINSTPDSALKVFPYQELSEVCCGLSK